MEVFPLRKPEEVFRDFRARRSAIIGALTTDVEKFYQECDPEKESLCLYGHPNETWEVKLPAEYVPHDFPEPTLGINLARDKMDKKDWLALVAQHSDAWLISLAFYFGARFNFGKEDRQRLFNMVNFCAPTIYEVVTRVLVEKPTEEEESTKSSMMKKNSELGLKSEEHENTLCGACGNNNAIAGYDDEFWICCDNCEKWFHGKCVKITPARAEHIKKYKCPLCSTHKRARA